MVKSLLVCNRLKSIELQAKRTQVTAIAYVLLSPFLKKPRRHLHGRCLDEDFIICDVGHKVINRGKVQFTCVYLHFHNPITREESNESDFDCTKSLCSGRGRH